MTYQQMDANVLASSEEQFVAGLEWCSLSLLHSQFENGAERVLKSNQDPKNLHQSLRLEMYRGYERVDTGERVTLCIVTDEPSWKESRVIGDQYQTWYGRTIMHWTDRKLDWFMNDEFVVYEKATKKFFWLDQGQMVPVTSLADVMSKYFFEVK
jgi:hypothetical protein